MKQKCSNIKQPLGIGEPSNKIMFSISEGKAQNK